MFTTFIIPFTGIPHLDIETNDAIILGYMIAEFLEEVEINYTY